VILTNVAIKNRTTIAVLCLLIVIAGTYSYIVLPRESAPDVPIPYIFISTVYEGVSPEDIESSVTIKIENELSGLRGVEEITSVSAEGKSTIVVEFKPDVPIDNAKQQVRDKVDLAKGDLPAEADEPVIDEISVAEFPILSINISGPVSMVRLKHIADNMQETIEQVPGVLEVDVLGTLEREIRLEFDPDRLAAYGLSLTEMLQLIPSENVNVSAGGLETPETKFNVRVPAEFTDPEDVDGLVVAVRDGRPIYFHEIVGVRDTFKDRDSYARLDGQESVSLAVKKRVGANTVQVADTVKRILGEAEKRAPKGVRFEITDDWSEDIRLVVKDLENNVLSGFILVVVVLVAFMGWRTSMIVALTIPMSMLITFSVLLAMGYTLNMIVLFSLIMALGMLVDNAIVIVENIYRHIELGYSRVQAAMKGTGEVAWPVITSTATTVSAFAPLAFWPGIMGEFMKYLPITLMITLSSSLFVALIINPTVSSLAAGGRKKRKTREHLIYQGYRALLRISIRHWPVTLILVGAVFVSVLGLYAKYGNGIELFPDVDPKRAMVDVRAPQGTNIEWTNQLTKEIEERIEPYRKYLDHVIANVGSAGGKGNIFGGGGVGPHLSTVTLVFKDFAERERPSAQIVSELRRDLSDLAGAEIKIQKQEEGPPTGAAVEVRLIGEDFDVLQDLSERVHDAIINVPGLVNLRSDQQLARPEFSFEVDRRKARLLGLNTYIIGHFLKASIFGAKVGVYRQFDEEYDITIRLPLAYREKINDLFRLRVPTERGDAVPLSSLGEFRYKGGLGTIRHVDRKRAITLTGDAEGRKSNEVLQDVQAVLKDMDFPAQCYYRLVGEREEQQKATTFLSKAFALAILFIVLILVTQFNTLTAPVIIMFSVLMSMIGVLVGLLATGLPFGIIMTGVGVISLAGVVVNNAIVLLDYTRQLQRRGLEIFEAAIQAGAIRLRPVLLTATTTILALIPMATGISFDFHVMEWATRSESSQWWRSMAIAVIFGLGFATLLTLVILPTLYVTIYRAASRIGLGGLRRKGTEEEPEPELSDY